MRLSHRLEKLEEAQHAKSPIRVFRHGPGDDAALEQAKQQAEEDGKLLIVIRQFSAQP